MQRLNRIVLVHGAAHGGWCWQPLAAVLRARGYEVAAPDLPGSGDDPTPFDEVTLDAYIQRVVDVVCAADGPVMLVGHSMGGIAISGAAEAVPERIGKLVYLAAILPKPGTRPSWLDLGANSIQQAIAPGAHAGTFEVDRARAAEVFYNTCDPATAAAAVERLRPQVTAPVFAPLTLTRARWGHVARTYIVCLQDKAVPTSVQMQLCDEDADIARRTLDTDHSPFYSDTEGLAEILGDEA